MRAQETGIVKRIYRIHKTTKPICQGSATVYSVEMSEVSLAFIILGGCKVAAKCCRCFGRIIRDPLMLAGWLAVVMLMVLNCDLFCSWSRTIGVNLSGGKNGKAHAPKRLRQRMKMTSLV